MPAGRLDVLIEGTGDDPRRIVLRAGDARLRALHRSRAGGTPGGRAGRGARGRRVEPMTGRPLLAIDTSGTRALVALGAPDGAAHRRAALAGRLSPRRGAADPDRRAADDEPCRAGASWAGSSSGPGPGRSPACASGSRPPRRWLAGWTSRSPASRHREALLAAAPARRVGEAGRPAAAGRTFGPSRSSSAEQATLVRGGEEPELDRRTPSSWPWTCRTAPRPRRWRWARGRRRALGRAARARGRPHRRRRRRRRPPRARVRDPAARRSGAVKGEVRWSHDRR